MEAYLATLYQLEIVQPALGVAEAYYCYYYYYYYTTSQNCFSKTVVLVRPSLAAAEGVFSLLNKSFSRRQSCPLKDYIEK